MSFTAVATLAVLGFVAAVFVYVQRPTFLIPAGVVVGILTCRPTSFGEAYPAVGPLILMGMSAIWAITAVGKRRPGSRSIWPMVWITMGWIWLFIHPMFAPGSESTLKTSTLTVFAPVVLFWVFGSDAQVIDRIRRLAVGVTVGAAALTTAAVLGGLAIGFSALRLGVVPVSYEELGSTLLAPGALLYGNAIPADFPRFLGLGREPGMGAIFIGWAFLAMPADWSRQYLWKGFLIVALVATQSTAGLGIFGAVWALRAVLMRSMPLLVRGLVVAAAFTGLYVAIYNPTFGLLAKMSAGGGVSYIDRNVATTAGWRALTENPFGTYSDLPLSSVNMIAGIAVNGAPWFVAMAIFLVLPIVRHGPRAWQAHSALLVFASLLFSQPLAGSTALIILSMISYYCGSSGKHEPLLDGPGAVAAERNADTGVVGR